jgi:hypothetical protein
MSRLRRSEGGFVHEAAAIVIGFALVGGALVLATFTRVNTDPSFQVRPEEPASGGGGPRQVTPQTIGIGPKLSKDPDAAECQRSVGARVGLTWAGSTKRWRAPADYPEPVLEGRNLEKDREVFSAWLDQMSDLVASVAADLAHCEEKPEPAPSPPPAPKLIITGQYDVEATGSGNAACPFPPPTMRWSIDEGGFSVTIHLGAAAVPLRGTLDAADLRFRVYADGQTAAVLLGKDSLLGIDLSITVKGRFDAFGGRTIVREGTGELVVAGINGQTVTCPFTYGATRAS